MAKKGFGAAFASNVNISDTKEETKITEEKKTVKTKEEKKNTTKKDTKSENTTTKKDVEVEKAVRRSSFGTKKKEEVKDTEILSVKFSEDVAEAFANEKVLTKKTVSAVATELLTNIYDKTTNTFTIDIPANHKMQTKDTTLNLPKDLKEALIANAKAKNMKTYEYFNKLMEAILES